MNVIETIGQLPMKQNKRYMENWGILFSKEPVKAAYTVGPSFATKISNIDFSIEDDKTFFNVDLKRFTQNSMIIDSLAIEDKIRSVFPFMQGSIKVPVGNLYNFIARQIPTADNMRKSRIIIKCNTGEEKQGCLLMNTQIINNEIVFTNPGFSEPLIVSMHSRKKEFIPGRMYQCEIMNTNSDYTEINVKYNYFEGIEIIIHESVTKYFPENLKDVEDSAIYPDCSVLRIPFVEEVPFTNFEPIHLDASLFFDILKLYKSYIWINIRLGVRVNPLIIVNDITNDNEPIVESIIVPLDPEVRGDVR